MTKNSPSGGKTVFYKERGNMNERILSKYAEEIEKLIEELRREGKLRGRVGDIVVFDRQYQLISIVSREGLQAIIQQSSESLGGWQTIKEE